MPNHVEALKKEISKIENKLEELKELAKDSEMKDMVEEEKEQLEARKKDLQTSVDAMTGKLDKEDEEGQDKNIDPRFAIIEIRAGAGGDEAGLFAGDLYRMYLKYLKNNNYKAAELDKSEGGIGNLKYVNFEVKGKNAYSLLRLESGVHRVQRVPTTESSGRIHTSTVSVAVMPKVKPVSIEIDPSDLEMDTFRSSGAGGQSVNKTDSAVRITHKPTGVVVSCQRERSQHRNREIAMDMLRSKLYEAKIRAQKEKIDELRADQVGNMERSEKIKTYNFPQNRLTDHRIGENWYNLPDIMEGGEALGDVLKETKEALRENDE